MASVWRGGKLLQALLKDEEGVGAAQDGQHDGDGEDQVVVVQTAANLHAHDVTQAKKNNWECQLFLDIWKTVALDKKPQKESVVENGAFSLIVNNPRNVLWFYLGGVISKIREVGSKEEIL